MKEEAGCGQSSQKSPNAPRLVKAVSATPTKSDRGQVAPHCLPSGALPREGPGGPGPPLGPENTIFSGFLPLNYVIYIFEVCFFMLFAMWED